MIREDIHTDEGLAVEAVNGSRHAFDLLVERHAPMVFNLCLKILGSYDDANDCAQEAFIRAFKSIRKFKMKSKFSTWICRIAVNICKNHISSSYIKHSKNSVSIDMPGTAVTSSSYVDRKASPEESAIRHEERETIQAAINSLPRDLKTVLVLRDIEGYSYDEIAQITGYRLGTVKSKLVRSRNYLRDALRGTL